MAGGELASSGSGTMFTPVGGLATGGIYQVTRNPMYVSLVFVALPTMSVVLDTAWPLILSPLTFSYLNFVVIAAEEALLRKSFGEQYEQYCRSVPRWLYI